MKKKDRNMDCQGCIDCQNCIDCRNCADCIECIRCANSTLCDSSVDCLNSTECDNCADCLYCDGLVLKKYHIFNKPLKKKEYEKIREKILENLGHYLHPKNLTEKNIEWLKKNVKQFDQKVLDRIITTALLLPI